MRVTQEVGNGDGSDKDVRAENDMDTCGNENTVSIVTQISCMVTYFGSQNQYPLIQMDVAEIPTSGSNDSQTVTCSKSVTPTIVSQDPPSRPLLEPDTNPENPSK